MTNYQKLKLVIISVFCFSFLFIFWNYSLNGRYIIKNDLLIILDTQTGTIYMPSNKEYIDLEGFNKRN
jgi:hypothetical protein